MIFGLILTLIAAPVPDALTPHDIPGCILWLDGKDVDGKGRVEGSCGTPISIWGDKSGQDHHASQSNLELQPERCPGGLVFDGDDCMLVPDLKRAWSEGTWSAFAVAALREGSGDHWRGIVGNRFGKGAPNWWTLGTKSTGTIYLELAAGVGVSPALRPGGNRPRLYAVHAQPPRFTLYGDGEELGAAERDNVGGGDNELRIGRWYGVGQGWDGTISEVLLFDRILSEKERKAVERYLCVKWDVPLLPAMYIREQDWHRTLASTQTALQSYLSECEGNIRVDPVQDLWALFRRDFPEESAWIEEDAPGQHLRWFREEWTVDFLRDRIGSTGEEIRKECNRLSMRSVQPSDPRWFDLYQRAALIRRTYRQAEKELDRVDFDAMRLALEDMGRSFERLAPVAKKRLQVLSEWERDLLFLREGLRRCDPVPLKRLKELLRFRRKALLDNPLLDFDKILLVKRSLDSPSLGLPCNWQSNCSLPRSGFNDEIASLSLHPLSDRLETVFRPQRPVFVGDVDLHFDGSKILFSSIGTNNCWQVFEMDLEGGQPIQVTPGDEPDVDSYDACYLPDEGIVFSSSAFMGSVPCVNGSSRTATLYRMDTDRQSIRQLCFDQEHNWCPTMLANGRIMYLRWEYTDTPHSHDRVLFHMNPDGTEQMAFYGSNSYWPNSLFYAKAIPGSASSFLGIVSGHHGVRRMGELVLFDAARGRREAQGAVQRIPGRGKTVEALIEDRLVDASWPKFLHPFPLNEKTFLAACQPNPNSLWGIYLVDVFDNLVLIKEMPGYAFLEPVPLRSRPRPPVIPNRVDSARKDALVYLADVYEGDGLKGIPRGSIKKLRLFTYHFLYPGMGGPQAVVGMEGPWDIKRIMGTVPVEEDGSALFTVPANTPISVQPLDEEGKAVQLMRSWFTAMPGETLSCVGCHESQNSTPFTDRTLAARQKPREIESWYGPTRGFNFEREVQPVLDAYCISCHDGRVRDRPNLKERKHITDYASVFHSGGKDAGHFSVSYCELHRYVRRPGLESDYHMLTPMEFHSDTTQLVQMLQKGHGGVKLNREAWDRLVTWMDLNAPFHGTLTEIAGRDRVAGWAKRRQETLLRYAGVRDDPEAIPDLPPPSFDVFPCCGGVPCKEPGTPENWTWEPGEARKRQESLGRTELDIALSEDASLCMVKIPPGEFLMGSREGAPDEAPSCLVRIEESFWMSQFEITNEQFAFFDPSHDSGVESRFSMQFGVRGFYVNGPSQPVVRVSWEEAMAFCAWLTETLDRPFTLPTEAQWEYACRAGTSTPFFFGEMDADWSSYANLADQTLREFVCHTYKKEREPWFHASKYDDWIPKDLRFSDKGFLSDGVGLYQPNVWGLHDMHGNVWEWTRTLYGPYPYDEADGRNDFEKDGRRVVRGGSWRDRPFRATSSFRLAYRRYQPVYNVGFRVVCAAN